MSLGLWAQDNCYSPQWSILEMLKYVPSEDSSGTCHGDHQTKKSIKFYTDNGNDYPMEMKNMTNVVGVVGQFTSQGAVSGTSVLEYFCLPLISVDSTSSDLDRQSLFPYFMRTVPSDKYQGAVLAALTNRFQWHELLVVYQESIYGRTLKDGFFEFVKKHHKVICIDDELEDTLGVGVNDGMPEWNQTLKEMRRYAEKEHYHHALLIFDVPTAKGFFNAIKLQPDLYELYQFIGPDGWSSSASVVADAENAVNGSIVIEGRAKNTTFFEDYLLNQTFNSTENIWLKELIGKQHNCCLGRECHSLENNTCSKDAALLELDEEGKNRAHFIVEAVSILAEAILQLCSNHSASDCPVAGPKLKEAMRNISVATDIARFTFYNGTNSGMPEYSIYQFQVTEDHPNGSWVLVAETEYIENDLPNITFNEEALMHTPNIGNTTWCRQGCGMGEGIVVRKNGPKCCFDCTPCLRYQIAPTATSECKPCNEGFAANEHYNQCIADGDRFVNMTEGLTSSSLGLSVAGLFACGIYAGFLLRDRESCAVEASGFYFNLAFTGSTALEFALPLLYLWEPSCLVCILQWCLATLNWTAFFAAIAVRSLYLKKMEKKIEAEMLEMSTSGVSTEDASSSSAASASSTRSSFRHVHVPSILPRCSQRHDLEARFGICLGIQCLFLIIWALLQPPNNDPHRAKDGYMYIQCSNMADYKSLVCLLWPTVLTVVGAWSSWRIMSSSLLFTRRLGRLSFIASTCMLIIQAVYAALVFHITEGDDPPSRLALEQFHAVLVGALFLATQGLPMLFFLAFRRYKNTPEYMHRISTGPQRKGMFIIDIYSLAEALRRSAPHRSHTS